MLVRVDMTSVMNNVSCVFTSLYCCRPVRALTLKGHSLRPGSTSFSHAAKIRKKIFLSPLLSAADEPKQRAPVFVNVAPDPNGAVESTVP